MFISRKTKTPSKQKTKDEQLKEQILDLRKKHRNYGTDRLALALNRPESVIHRVVKKFNLQIRRKRNQPFKKFCKIETVIHTIPNVINPIMHWAEKKYVQENKSTSKYGIALALYCLKVLGLSGGFVTVGNLMHKWLGMGGKGSMEGLTEMLVGACPAELASSTKAILLPDS